MLGAGYPVLHHGSEISSRTSALLALKKACGHKWPLLHARNGASKLLGHAACSNDQRSASMRGHRTQGGHVLGAYLRALPNPGDL